MLDLSKPRFRFETIDSDTLEFFIPFKFDVTDPDAPQAMCFETSLYGQIVSGMHQAIRAEGGIRQRRHLFMDPDMAQPPVFASWEDFSTRYQIGKVIEEEFCELSIQMGSVNRILREGVNRIFCFQPKGELVVVYNAETTFLGVTRDNLDLPEAGIMGHIQLVSPSAMAEVMATANGLPVGFHATGLFRRLRDKFKFKPYTSKA